MMNEERLIAVITILKRRHHHDDVLYFFITIIINTMLRFCNLSLFIIFYVDTVVYHLSGYFPLVDKDNNKIDEMKELVLYYGLPYLRVYRWSTRRTVLLE